MTKPVIIKREVKGTPLTYAELDTNFQNLKDATVTVKAGTGGTDVVSDLNGVITLVAGSGIVLAGDNTAKTVTLSTTESQNIFQNIAVAGQSTVTADSTGDTLTLVAGTNITITTNATTDSITINSAFDLVNDTTPQLGGNLDVNGFSLVSVSNGNITLAPNGTGRIQLDKNIKIANAAAFISDSNIFFFAGGTYPGTNPAATNTQCGIITNEFIIGDGYSKAELTSNGAQNLELNTSTGTNSGTITITAGANGNITIDPNGTGNIVLDGPLSIAATTGTPTTYENGYYEDMLQTPVTWLKINIGASVYYLPLFQ